MQNLIETYQRLLSEIVPSYHRRFYDEFVMDGRMVGIVGARGVGKTTFLIHYLREHYNHSDTALYISADNLYFVEHTLLEVVDQFMKNYAGEVICIDEIHRYKNWNQELKNIYDSYPKLSILFSGSSSIDLIHGKYDLSRRANLQAMCGFSFREFLEIQTQSSYKKITLDDLCTRHITYEKEILKTPKILGYFKQYLKSGYYPTFLELIGYDAYQSSLRGIIDKIIYEDISSLYSLNTSNLDTIKRILYFFGTSQPGSVNVNRLAGSLKKDHSTIAQYIQILKDTSLLRFLSQNKHGHALVRDTEKIYIDNPNLLYALNREIGKEPFIGVVRELFVLGALQNANYHVFFPGTADFESEGYVFEVGGKNKKVNNNRGKQPFVVKDDILLGDPNTIPLYMFGFLS